MTFQEKLVILRKTRGLTQDEFASAVGVSRQAVYKWESGQSYPEVQKLLEIKTLFSISIDDLLDDNYEVALPEKKRRKRISKETKEKIEKSVEKDETVVIPISEKTSEEEKTPEVKKEPEKIKEETVASEIKSDDFTIAIKEEPAEVAKEETKADEVDEKKTSFFGKFFAKR